MNDEQAGTAEVRIALDPKDWFRATWRTLNPLPQPAPRPFDRKRAMAKLTQTRRKGHRWEWYANYAMLTGFHDMVTSEEGAFWFAAMAEETMQREEGSLTPTSLAEKFAANPPSGPTSPAQMHQVFSAWSEPIPEFCLPFLLSQLSVREIIAAIFEGEEAAIQAHGGSNTERIYYQCPWHILEGFRRYVRPFLSGREVQEVRDFLRPRLDLSLWPATTQETPRIIFPLAAVFGLSNELRPLIESWADDAYQGGLPDPAFYHRPQNLIFGLSSGEEVQTQMRRLRLRLQAPQEARAWLAHTEFSALGFLQEAVSSIKRPEERSEAIFRQDDCAELLRVLGLAEAPETAPLMLELIFSSLASATARHWLDTHTAHTVTGLLPLAGGDGLWAEPARLVLSGVRRRGQAALLEAGLVSLSPEAAAQVRADLLTGDDALPFDDTTTPNWLRDAPQQGLKRSFYWREPTDLPVVTLGSHGLNDAQTETLLRALGSRKKQNDPPHPFVAAVKSYADPESLDLFIWRLFERWHLEAAPSFWKWGRWTLLALGLLGGDLSARKLTPVILIWSNEKQHSLAVLGLEVLRAIGTDTALRQIREIAQNAPLRRLKTKAGACLEGIAAERSLSRAELENKGEEGSSHD